MGRYYWNKRDTTDDYKKFTIAFLKKHGYLETSVAPVYGNIRWSIGDQETGSMGFWIEKNNEIMRGNIRVIFTQTKHDTGEKKEFDYKIPLIATKCNFGGIRWWFLDPCSEKEIKCLTLYWQSNGYFASRKTLNLAYESQNESRFGRRLSYFMCMNATKALVIKETMKYPFRNGKPTRKMRRFLKLSYNSPTMTEIHELEKTLFRRSSQK